MRYGGVLAFGVGVIVAGGALLMASSDAEPNAAFAAWSASASKLAPAWRATMQHRTDALATDQERARARGEYEEAYAALSSATERVQRAASTASITRNTGFALMIAGLALGAIGMGVDLITLAREQKKAARPA